MDTLRRDQALAAHYPLGDLKGDTTFAPAIPIGEREVDSSSAKLVFGVKDRPSLETVLDMAHALTALDDPASGNM